MNSSWKRRASELAAVALLLAAGLSAPVGVRAQASDCPTALTIPILNIGLKDPGCRPTLEIPVPGVEFSDIIRDGGSVTVPWLAQYISGVYLFLLSIAGFLAAAMIVVGGFEYVTSGGDAGKAGAGKKRIVGALTGLALALGSYTILYTINPALVRFEGLRVGRVNPQLLNAHDGLSNENLPPEAIPSGTAPAAPVTPVTGGAYAKLCTSAATCLPYCQAAGCTKMFCTKAEIAAGYGRNCIGSTNANDCDLSRFPALNSPSVLTSNSPDLIPSGSWPRMANIKARGGVKASRLVLDGLQRADAYISQNYAGQGLAIQINNCWRDWRDDANGQCAVIVRPTKNNPSEWLSSWPGSGPHSSGYACDVLLTRNGQAISSGTDNQACASKLEGNKLLVTILTNPTVGARRLNYESWHFNWAGWNSCFCAMEGCDAFNPPIPSGDRKCTHRGEPKPSC